MEQNDYIHIQANMVIDLGLRGNELIVYALVHGYCKDGIHEFRGSINYICEWTNLSRNTVISILKQLVEKGLLIKRTFKKNNVSLCAYSLGGSAKTAPVVQKLDGGSAKIAPNNTINNTIEKKDKEESLSKKIETDVNFEQCWIAYKRKGSKKKSKEYWKKLTIDEQQQVLPHIKAYVSSRDLQYQKDFERYLRDKIFQAIVYQGNVIVFDPTKKDKNATYTPETGFSLNWNDYYNCYLYTGYWNGYIPDGYKDEDRPNGASVTLNNGRGIVVWDSNLKRWEKK